MIQNTIINEQTVSSIRVCIDGIYNLFAIIKDTKSSINKLIK